MSVRELAGLVPILPTPLDASGAIDEAGVRHLVRHCVEAGLDGVVVLGSNGEFPYLALEEKRRVMAAAAEAAAGRVPVIGTASASSTEQAIELARAARQAGCDAVMALLTAYWRVGPDEAYEHYSALAREGGLPVFLYYFPEVSGLTLRPRDFAAIAAIDGVVGAKVTVLNARFLRRVIAATRPAGWRTFTGTSFLLAECVAAGGAGVFCPLPLLAPALLRELLDAIRAGPAARLRRLHARVLRGLPLFSGLAVPGALQAIGFSLLSRLPYSGPGRRPAPTHALLKEALRQRGHPITATVRRPHREVTPAQQTLVRRTLAALERA